MAWWLWDHVLTVAWPGGTEPMSSRLAGAGPGDVGVVIVDPQGRRDTVEVMLEDKGDNIYRCTYRPVLEGPHTVCVTYAGAQIPKSPFTVNVAEGETCPGGAPPRPHGTHRCSWCPHGTHRYPRWPHGIC